MTEVSSPRSQTSVYSCVCVAVCVCVCLCVQILGGGSFGLALATLLGKKSIPVTILVRKQEVCVCVRACVYM